MNKLVENKIAIILSVVTIALFVVVVVDKIVSVVFKDDNKNQPATIVEPVDNEEVKRYPEYENEINELASQINRDKDLYQERCYQITPEFLGEHSYPDNNYSGSFVFDRGVLYIWVSNGTLLASGNVNNLEVVEDTRTVNECTN